MCFGRDPMLGIQPVLFSLSELLTETSFSVSFSLKKKPALKNSKYAKQPPCLYSYHLEQGPSTLTHPINKVRADCPRVRGTFNTKAVEIQTNWPIRVSHGYKYSSARAILRDGGMGKFGLES